MIDLFIVENVSKIINQKNVVVPDLTEDQVAVEMTEDQVMVETIEVLGLVGVQEMMDLEKHLLSLVVIVAMNVKFHSSQEMIDLFIVENVSKIINQKNVVVPDLTEDQVAVEMTEDQASFTVTCGDCGNECQVPFKPRDGRPVYCNDCFQDHK
jgi:CxxC-x17-CxxC domain-containing protein